MSKFTVLPLLSWPPRSPGPAHFCLKRFIPQSVSSARNKSRLFYLERLPDFLLQDWICNNNYLMVIKTNILYFLFKQISSLQIALLLQPFCRLLPGCDIFFYSQSNGKVSNNVTFYDPNKEIWALWLGAKRYIAYLNLGWNNFMLPKICFWIGKNFNSKSTV